MRVAGLWRHPVKSVPGEPVARVTVGRDGVVGDRGWGVRDLASGAILSAKREPRLLLLGARARGEGVELSVPGHGTTSGAEADRLLTGWLGRPVRLHAAPEAAYVDEAHLHLLTRAEIGRWDVRRFRPNVAVYGVDSLDDLVGERLRVGPVVVEVSKRTKRCAMPTMAQAAGSGPELVRDVEVLRSLARGRDLRLGVYARVVTTGTIAVGADVRIV